MKKIVNGIVIAILLIIAIIFGYNKINTHETVNKTEVVFKKCVDGDTAHFLVNGEDKKIRLLAINTPEITHDDIKGEYYGQQASDYVCSLLSKSKEIELEYDSLADATDKYGRVLAWVWVDDQLLQELIVKNGYGKVDYVYDNYKYVDLLYEAQAKAQKNELGIWKEVK